jgi:hypothetical protein
LIYNQSPQLAMADNSEENNAIDYHSLLPESTSIYKSLLPTRPRLKRTASVAFADDVETKADAPTTEAVRTTSPKSPLPASPLLKRTASVAFADDVEAKTDASTTEAVLTTSPKSPLPASPLLKRTASVAFANSADTDLKRGSIQQLRTLRSILKQTVNPTTESPSIPECSIPTTAPIVRREFSSTSSSSMLPLGAIVSDTPHPSKFARCPSQDEGFQSKVSSQDITSAMAELTDVEASPLKVATKMHLRFKDNLHHRKHLTGMALKSKRTPSQLTNVIDTIAHFNNSPCVLFTRGHAEWVVDCLRHFPDLLKIFSIVVDATGLYYSAEDDFESPRMMKSSVMTPWGAGDQELDKVKFCSLFAQALDLMDKGLRICCIDTNIESNWLTSHPEHANSCLTIQLPHGLSAETIKNLPGDSSVAVVCVEFDGIVTSDINMTNTMTGLPEDLQFYDYLIEFQSNQSIISS